MTLKRIGQFFGIAVFGAAVAASPTMADSVADFYRGKTITIQVGAGIGSGVDITTRLIARNLGKYIPGQPAVIVKNMTGSGGLRLYNYLYAIAPKDGTEFGTVVQFAFEHLFAAGGASAQFDAARFRWLGGPVRFATVAVAWNASTPVRKAENLLTHEVVIGATSASANSATDAYVARNVLGFKYKVVLGYPGGADLDLAMIRGETQGRVQLTWSALKQRNPDWMTDGKISLLYQAGLEKSSEIPANVPLLLDFAKTPEDRQVLELKFSSYSMGYPIFGPPEVPADRLVALRLAFANASSDPTTRAEAAKQRIDLDPIAGETIEGIIRKAHESPPSIVARLLEALKPPQ